jgi:hypothetical protein
VIDSVRGWKTSTGGLIVPHHTAVHDEARVAVPATRAKVRRQDMIILVSTVVSAIVAVLALVVAMDAQRDQQKADAARQVAENRLTQQMAVQTMMQARLAQLQARDTALGLQLAGAKPSATRAVVH